MKKLLVVFLLVAATCGAITLPKTWVASETITAADLNSNFQALNGAIASLTTEVAAGCIMLWSGSTGSIPSGWALCDGTNGTPDLTDKFVVGAGSTYGVASAAGSTTVTITSVATTTVTAATTASSVVATDTMVVVVASGSDYSVNTSTHTHNISAATSATGTTTVSSTATGHLPPYYALCYIMKL